MRNLKKRNTLIICTGLIVSAVCIVLAINFRDSSSNEPINHANMLIGYDPDRFVDVVCNADYLNEIEVDYSYWNKLAEGVNIEKYCLQITPSFVHVMKKDTENQEVLTGAKGCYVSTVSVMMFNIRENAVASVRYAYTFTDEKEPAGYIMFNISPEGKIMYSTTWRSKDVRYYTDILSFLSDDPETKYIILTNGHGDIYYLDEENNLFHRGAGSAPDVTIEGDYYHALDYEHLAVSYNTIADESNLIKIVGTKER